jgi:hypothetical protein
MSNTTTPVVATAKPKQFTFGVSEKVKGDLTELRNEFSRPAAVKNAEPVTMTEKEILEVIHTVATDRRFKTIPVMESFEVDGEKIEAQAIDEDGNPKFETIDLFEIEWEKIKSRDYSAIVTDPNSTESIIKSLRKVGAQLKLSDESIQKMIDNALAARGEAKPAATPPPRPVTEEAAPAGA